MFYIEKTRWKEHHQNNGVCIDGYDNNRRLDTYYGRDLGAGLWTTKDPSFPVSVGLTNKPFIWAKNVVQVFIANDLAKEGKLVLKGRLSLLKIEFMEAIFSIFSINGAASL